MTLSYDCSDGSGSIDRDEFLQIPQIATNPLASRMIAIFDEECASLLLWELETLLTPLAVVEGPSTFKNSLED